MTSVTKIEIEFSPPAEAVRNVLLVIAAPIRWLTEGWYLPSLMSLVLAAIRNTGDNSSRSDLNAVYRRSFRHQQNSKG
ncbi:unnamed protein product [Nezara viridula]|uniref:Uncharacterized protein n=1 Tax=Nezara viridula TaxID=85310 RepID=A0A9P0HC97_NEZVI|nr:unnamed protein product [Nezara viridula]